MHQGESMVLFYPGYEDTASDTFEVAVGGQTTVVAMGLLPGEYVELEMVLVPAAQPNLCACVPYAAELPTVAATAPLNCCNGRIRLTAERGYVVLDAPQGVRLRALAETGDNSSLWVWAIGTATKFPSEYMRGCGNCGGSSTTQPGDPGDPYFPGEIDE